ncbi:hypothetical protein BV25DRAFT_1818092 [Artomyces pyxidatus]|uniref:Uncharacterized protein n=1 Tax=Artomyces pyxidatus TaxID=48021 RepID=A0ACB8TL25_9AGAM|nr:hypothetical protein BV25DRAFT_1818092 [Artomyces pyxidatus]
MRGCAVDVTPTSAARSRMMVMQLDSGHCMRVGPRAHAHPSWTPGRHTIRMRVAMRPDAPASGASHWFKHPALKRDSPIPN